jgi:hypothetical protein
MTKMALLVSFFFILSAFSYAHYQDAGPAPVITLHKFNEPPVLDGNLKEWGEAVRVNGFTLNDGSGYATPETAVYAGYDDQNLYLAYLCQEPGLDTLSSKQRKADDWVWQDESVEVIAMADEVSDHAAHIVVNHQGVVYDARGLDPENSEWNSGIQTAAGKTDYAWTLEMAIPLNNLPAGYWDKKTLKINFYRSRYLKGEKYSSWSYCPGSFKEPQRLGTVLFKEDSPWVESDIPVNALNKTHGLGWGFNRIGCRYRNPQGLKGNFIIKLKAISPAGEEVRHSVLLGREKSQNMILPFRVKGHETSCLLQLQDAEGNILSQTVFPVKLKPYPYGGELLSLIKEFEPLGKDENLPNGLREVINQRIAQGKKALKAMETPGEDAPDDWKQKAQATLAAYQKLAQLQVIGWHTGSSENITPDQKPFLVPDEMKLDFTGMQEEYLSGSLNLTNLSQHPYQARILFSELTGKSAAGEMLTVPPENLEFRKVVFRKLRNGKTYGDALVTLGDGSLIDIPPQQTGQLWVTLKTSHLAAGDYHGALLVKPVDERFPNREIQISLKVYPFVLPEKMPITTYLWDYAPNDAYVKDLLAHKVNTMLVNCFLCPPECDSEGNILKIDFTEHDMALAMKRKYGNPVVYSYGVIPMFNDYVAKPKGWAYLSEPWQKAFKGWIRQWVSHLKEKGMDYQDYSIQIWDEATGDAVSKVTSAGPLLREIDPKIRWVMDGAQTLPEAQLMDPYVDIWIPHLDSLWKSAYREPLTAFYKSTHKPVWCYTCRINMTAQPVLEYYRLKPWYAWKLGFDGVCFWDYNSWRGDPWSDFDVLGSEGYSDNGVVYSGANGPVTSRRWEAFRDGLQDYQYLYLLNQAILKAESSNNPEQVSLARESRVILNSAVEDVLATQSEPRLLEWRDKIIQQLLKLDELTL